MDRIITAIMRLMPEKLLGDTGEMTRRYNGARASGNAHPLATELRKRTASHYLILLLALVPVCAAAIWQLSSGSDMETIKRPGPGGDPGYVEASVDASYEGSEIERQVQVAVQPEELSPEEIAASLSDLKKRLGKEVFGEGDSMDDVTSDLALPSSDERTGAVISWRSNRPEIISDDGRVNLIEGKAGEEVSLEADITLGEATDSLVLDLVMGDPGDGYDYSEDLGESIARIVSDLSGSDEGGALSLPDATESGIAFSWKRPRETGALMGLVIIPAIGFLVYRGRYRGMDKAVAAMRDSIRKDFPDFLSKLLLLLNAGLVVTAAVAKIADDYRARRREGEEKVFFEELLGMEDRIRGANASLSAEFADLAARSGQREVMRFSTILADNIDKGSALADKIMQEEGMLRAMRKKRAEERGRLAETKLTFPMALQLGAIIIITVAPAAFEMQ